MKRLLCLLIVLLSFLGFAEQLEIHFIDVGQGDAVLIRSPAGQNVLYDGGRSRLTALNYLRSIGVESLDMVIASHPDADHIGGLIEAVRYYRPRFFMDNGIAHTTQTYENLLLAVDEAESELLEPFARRINLGPVALQILPPPGISSWSNNDNSVGVIIEFGAFRAGLSGDAEHRQFAWWSERGFMQPVQVYKSSHHGSPNGDTETSMNGFQPEVVVISVGAGNAYGHPAPEILQLYQRFGARIYRTDLQGNIVVLANEDGSYQILTDRAAPDMQVPIMTQPVVTCVDINTASLEVLTQIVHISEVRALELINLRPFTSLNQLTRIRGIAEARLQDILNQGLACVGE